MELIRCLFVGGPYDGAWLEIGPDDYLPEHWYVRPDPGGRGRFGLCARPDKPNGGERYVLSNTARDRAMIRAVYQHESVRTNVDTRTVEGVA